MRLTLAQAAVLGVPPFHPGWETMEAFERRSAFIERVITEQIASGRAWRDLVAEYRVLLGD